MKKKFALGGKKLNRHIVSDPLPPSLITALSDLMRWSVSGRVPLVIVGGVAASLLGRTRLTRDIDALVSIAEDRWQAAVEQSKGFGFLPRIENAVEFAQRSRVLLLRHVATDIEIDLMLCGLPFEQDAVSNARLVNVDGVMVALPRVEDLLIMKAIAHRPRDMADIEGLIDAHPETDFEFVRKWVKEFSIAATMPDLLTDLEKLVERAPQK